MSGAPTNQYWSSIASSADGRRLIAGGRANASGISQNDVFTSADAGATWATNDLPELGYVPFVASSADGTTLMAVPTDFSVARDSLIFTSTNSGTTWIQAMAPDAAWGGVACSADGLKLFGAAHPTPVGLLDGNQIGGIYSLQITNYPTLSLTCSAGSAGDFVEAIFTESYLATKHQPWPGWLDGRSPAAHAQPGRFHPGNPGLLHERAHFLPAQESLNKLPVVGPAGIWVDADCMCVIIHLRGHSVHVDLCCISKLIRTRACRFTGR